MFNWNKSFKRCLVDGYFIKLIETDLSLKQVLTPMRRLVLTVSFPFLARLIFFLQFFIKYSIHHPLSADTSLKFLAFRLSRYRIYKIPSLCLSKSHNFTRGVTDLEFCNVKVLCLKLLRPHFLQTVSQI